MSDKTNNGASHRETSRGLTVAALGVVYGDIGTSPLYSIKQCFQSAGSVSEPAVYGVSSLIVWTLTDCRYDQVRSRAHACRQPG
jgi:KUP system potassium uptake protein